MKHASATGRGDLRIALVSEGNGGRLMFGIFSGSDVDRRADQEARCFLYYGCITGCQQCGRTVSVLGHYRKRRTSVFEVAGRQQVGGPGSETLLQHWRWASLMTVVFCPPVTASGGCAKSTNRRSLDNGVLTCERQCQCRIYFLKPCRILNENAMPQRGSSAPKDQ